MSDKTIYVTKYALTKGPFEVEAEVRDDGKSAYWRDNYHTNSAYGKEFYATKESAIADCERRRKERLASLKKQIAKLEKMEFKL
ncbi:hypothetical protein AU509_11990 [Lonsdalea britannica]|uniref:Uncharacterized protein n=2 Tax=Lonsdalea britannica TaxID=1082704 RepID=A0AAD0SHL3_9GAMM|nr:hypothetical protein [Lonsdalea britannica]AXW87796.1 hypothetical protein CKQ53_13000 [Lonsdalea britannica]OSM95921.1 hypothetical protein AU509_11990 [Lonsdalea britannica]